MKLISVSLFNPIESTFFKKEHAKCELFYCGVPDNCSLLKQNYCINRFILNSRCPHGYVDVFSGPTRRSTSLGKWITEKEKEYGEQLKSKVSSPPMKIASVGDYYYLPYSHLDMNKDVPILEHSRFIVGGSPFIKKELFTIEVIKSIVKFRPQAIFGGEITHYQKHIVPLFLKHLSEEYKEIYENFLTAYPEFSGIPIAESNIGRKALLITTEPHDNIEIMKDNIFRWDGKKLTSIKCSPFMLYTTNYNGQKAMKEINVEIVPSEDAVITITDDKQVSNRTKFMD